MNIHSDFADGDSRVSRDTLSTPVAPQNRNPGGPLDRGSHRSTIPKFTGRRNNLQELKALLERNAVETTPKAARARTACWPIILAGGEGVRLRPLVQRWLGTPRPKQYCAFYGTRTMLQHTLGHALRLSESDHSVTIIGAGHRRYLDKKADAQLQGSVIEQPRNLGTATGVFLGATYVLSRDPNATAVLLPSDHFVFPEDRFLSHLNRLRALAEQFENSIVLLGAIPNRAETDYGWIEPCGDCGLIDARPGKTDHANVRSFHEKPDRDLARRLYQSGFLWNTMVAAVKVRTLWRIGWRLLPEMMGRFEELHRVLRLINAGRIGAEHESSALLKVYEDLGEADLSRNILQTVAHDCIVLPMKGVIWSDWGQPRRIAETLNWIGVKGNVPPGTLEPGSELKR